MEAAMQKTLIKQALATDKPVQGISLCGTLGRGLYGEETTPQ